MLVNARHELLSCGVELRAEVHCNHKQTVRKKRPIKLRQAFTQHACFQHISRLTLRKIWTPQATADCVVGLTLRVLVLLVQAHRHREVVLAEEEHVAAMDPQEIRRQLVSAAKTREEERQLEAADVSLISDGETHRPGRAAISSMFSMQDAVSTWRATIDLSEKIYQAPEHVVCRHTCRATMTLSLWTPAYPRRPFSNMERCGK